MPRTLIAIALLVAAQLAAGQAPPRRPLEHRDTENWNSATGTSFSPDGKWIAAILTPPEGDAAVVIKNVETGTETRIPTGGKPPEAAPPSPDATPSGGLQFTPDSKKLLAPLTPLAAEVKKKAKTKPQAVLAIIDLATGKVAERLERVRGYRVVGKGAGTLIAQAESAPASAEAAAALVGGLIVPPGVRPKPPADLLVRPLAAGQSVTIPAVTEYTLTKDESLLLATNTEKEAGVVALKLPLDAAVGLTFVVTKPGRFSRFAWDEPQKRAAFYHTPKPAKPGAESPPPAVWVWQRDGNSATEVVAADAKGLPEKQFVAERGRLDFSRDGLKLEFFTAAKPEKSATPPAATAGRSRRAAPAADAKPADASAVDLDLWHWRDEAIQPMQKIRAAIDRSKTFRACYFFDTKVVRPLSTEDLDVPVPNFGDWAVASSDKPYAGQLWLSPRPRDFKCVNVRTGETKPLLSAFEGQVAAPFGDTAVAFDGTDWLGYAVPSGESVNLTKSLGVRFDNEEFDLPTSRPPHGLRGWTSDRKSVIVSDRHDLWRLALDGSSAVNLTKIGREQNLEFSIVPVGDDFSTLQLNFSKPVLLAAVNLTTRDEGFYRLEPGQAPKLLTTAAKNFGRPSKAKDADKYLLTAQTFADYPDYYVADADFKELKRVTDIQPRARDYNWGTAELVQYTSTDGIPLQGVLIKPQDFDAKKKYPLIVYLYERLSDKVHSFRLPTPGTSINPTYYASNGYLVLMPDIAYTAGSPGQSSLKCVLPAIQAVVNRGCVDEAAIGIQGHSWGGYQAAYLVTQTTRFAAAAAGAPVSNMVSAYGGVRWGSGLPRQFQYERTQSRIGKTLWDAPTRYIENSPIFYADKVQTPLLMLHNDQDDAVPWYQGIEYYLALRRLGKEVYLLNYVGQPHGLRKKSAQRDYTVRMSQFFDHHLKGKPAPAWMRDGVPYTERDKEKLAIQKLFEAPKK